MPTRPTNMRERTPWRALLGVLCLVLMLVGTTIATSHIHLDSDLSHADCALCVTAHTAVAPVASSICVFGFQVLAAIDSLPSSPFKQHRLAFALYTRPPPADAHLS